MEVYQSEQEQIEALRNWWRENGKSVVFGVILGLGAIFGWREWQDYRVQQAEDASILYEQMMTALRAGTQTAEARTTAGQIIDDYGSSTYAVFAQLALARLAAQDNDYAKAIEHLRWALEHNRIDAVEPLIRLRLARVLAAGKQYPEALQMLQEGDPGPYAAGFDELRGDIKREQGDIEAAREAYQEAVANNRAINNDVTVLELKLDDLGRVDEPQ